jgi:hypothetical protein
VADLWSAILRLDSDLAARRRLLEDLYSFR